MKVEIKNNRVTLTMTAKQFKALRAALDSVTASHQSKVVYGDVYALERSLLKQLDHLYRKNLSNPDQE